MKLNPILIALAALGGIFAITRSSSNKTEEQKDPFYGWSEEELMNAMNNTALSARQETAMSAELYARKIQEAAIAFDTALLEALKDEVVQAFGSSTDTETKNIYKKLVKQIASAKSAILSAGNDATLRAKAAASLAAQRL
jgi:hypothetical protein